MLDIKSRLKSCRRYVSFEVSAMHQEAAVLTIGSGNKPCPSSVTDSFTKGEELYLWMEWTLTTSVMQLTQIYRFLFQKEYKEKRREKTRINNIGTNRCKYVRPMGQDTASGCCTRPCYCSKSMVLPDTATDTLLNSSKDDAGHSWLLATLPPSYKVRARITVAHNKWTASLALICWNRVKAAKGTFHGDKHFEQALPLSWEGAFEHSAFATFCRLQNTLPKPPLAPSHNTRGQSVKYGIKIKGFKNCHARADMVLMLENIY